VHFSVIERNRPRDFIPYLITTFSWPRFLGVSLWIMVLFLIYVTAAEVSHLFGRGELRRLFFTSRPSELQLDRRQRIRELLDLSRLADEHSMKDLSDPGSAAHPQVIEILRRLARQREGSPIVRSKCSVKRRVSRAEQNYSFLLSAFCGIPPFICRKGR
jgi:hypothetical protein